MEILGGFELQTKNGLFDPVVPDGERVDAFVMYDATELLVDDGGRLVTGRMMVYGDATVGPDGYVFAKHDVEVVAPVPGTGLQVDGMLRAPLLRVANVSPEFGITGAATLSGDGQIAGDVLVAGAVLAPGAEIGELTIHGQLVLDSDSKTVFELAGSQPRSDFDQLTVGSASLDGTLDVILNDEFSPRLGEEFRLIGLLDETGVLEGAFTDPSLPIFDDKTFALQVDAAGVTLSVVAAPGVPLGCDINGDGVCDVTDIDTMTQQVLNGERTAEERLALIQDKMPAGFETYLGDADLDGKFDSSDLVMVFQAGHYEDGIDRNSAWAQGDWDGDLDFTTSDLVAAFEDGGYDQGRRPAVKAVPEPSGIFVMAIALVLLLLRSRR